MADLIVVAITDEVAITQVGGATTVLQIAAPTNQRLKVLAVGVYFDGTSPTAEPVEVEVIRQTDAGTMSSLTPKIRGCGSESVQSSAQHTATVEPTSGDVVDAFEVHPQTAYEVNYPVGQEVKVAGGGRVGIVCTAPADVNVRAKFVYEE